MLPPDAETCRSKGAFSVLEAVGRVPLLLRGLEVARGFEAQLFFGP